MGFKDKNSLCRQAIKFDQTLIPKNDVELLKDIK